MELRAARLLLEEEFVAPCLSRAYYAMFCTAQAALLGREETPKTHSGTLARFAFHFVRTGALPKTTGTLLRDAFSARQKADYDSFTVFDSRAAADALADAEAFVAAVRPLVTAP